MTPFHKIRRAFSRWTIDFEPIRKSYWNGFNWRTRSFEFSVYPKKWWELSLELLKFDENYSVKIALLGAKGYFKIPISLLPVREEPEDILDCWGFNFGSLTESFPPTDLVFEWGPGRRKSIYMPWMWNFHSHEVRQADGTWVKADNSRFDGKDGRYQETYPYTYICLNGEVQIVQATIYAERRTWRWLALPKLPWPSRTETCIDVVFSESVGEGRGSWKGGCIGCGYPLLPTETMEQCLRRMEAERKFSR